MNLPAWLQALGKPAGVRTWVLFYFMAYGSFFGTWMQGWFDADRYNARMGMLQHFLFAAPLLLMALGAFLMPKRWVKEAA